MNAFTRITRVDAWAINVPLLHEWIASPEMGGSHPHGHDRIVVRITDADGFEGWGERSFGGSPQALAAAAKQLMAPTQPLRPQMLELEPPASRYWTQPAPPSPYAQPIHNMIHRVRHDAQTIFEMPLYDLFGRRAGVPMSYFFGGPWRDRILTDYWMGRTTPEMARRCVKRGLSLGFTHGIKCKTMLLDPNVERLEAIAEAAGGTHYKVTVDPNGRMFRLDDALPTLLRMDAVGNMSIMEDPFPRFHLAEFAALRPRLVARVVLHIDPPEMLWQVLASNAVGGINTDSHAQGLFAWRCQAAAAHTANLPLWHGSGLDLGIYTAAQLHLAASAPNCILPGDQIGPWVREATLVKQPFRVEQGHVLVPQGAGLGIEVDLAQIEKYAAGHATWSA